MDHIFRDGTSVDQPTVYGDGSTLPCDEPAPSLPVATLISPPARPFDSMATPVDVSTTAPPPRPWGPWATVGWCVLGGILEVIVTIIVILVAGVAAVIRDPQGISYDKFITEFLSSGLMLSLVNLLMVPVGLAYLVLIIRWRGWRVRDYLAMNRVTRRQALTWLALMAALGVINGSLMILTGWDMGSTWMVDTWRTAGSVPLLVLTIVVLAPFMEEIVFRGFLYRGIAASRLGPVGAILISSLLWSLLHVQYDWFVISLIAAEGLLLGVARHRSGSVVPPILMHVLMNAVAVVIIVIQLSGTP